MRGDEAATPRGAREKHRAEHDADDHRDDRRLGSEDAARQPLRPDDLAAHDAGRGRPRSRHTEDAAFCEVPAGVDADRQPEATGQHVGAGQHDPAFEDDSDRAKNRRVRVEKMDAAEEDRRERKRRPGSAPLLEQPEDDAAKDDLLDRSRGDRREQREHDGQHGAEADDAIRADEREDRDRRRERAEAERHSGEQLAAPAGNGQLDERAPLEGPHIGAVRGPADHGRDQHREHRGRQPAEVGPHAPDRDLRDQHRKDEHKRDPESGERPPQRLGGRRGRHRHSIPSSL